MKKWLVVVLFLSSPVAAEDLWIQGPDGSLKYKVTENPYSGACCEVYDYMGRWIGSIDPEPYNWSGDNAFQERTSEVPTWESGVESEDYDTFE